MFKDITWKTTTSVPPPSSRSVAGPSGDSPSFDFLFAYIKSKWINYIFHVNMPIFNFQSTWLEQMTLIPNPINHFSYPTWMINGKKIRNPYKDQIIKKPMIMIRIRTDTTLLDETESFKTQQKKQSRRNRTVTFQITSISKTSEKREAWWRIKNKKELENHAKLKDFKKEPKFYVFFQKRKEESFPMHVASNKGNQKRKSTYI